MGCLQSSPDNQTQVANSQSNHEKPKQVQKEEQEDEKTNIALHNRMIMNISELEAFVGKKHTDTVYSLLTENIALLFSKGTEYGKLFANCVKILEIEGNTIYYDYYAFFAIDFLFHYLRNRSSDNSNLYELLLWIKPLIDKIENGESIPRISSASVYGMEACLLIDPRCYEPEKIPMFVKQQYFGYDLSCWYIDGRRLYLDLIKKGMSIDNHDKYCQYALSIHYSEIEAYNKALYFCKKCGFSQRPDVSESMQEIEKKFEREEQRCASSLERYEENKDKFDSEEHHGNLSISDFYQTATGYALQGEYEKGFAFFDETLRWNVFRCKYEKYEYSIDMQTRLYRLEYVLKFGYDFEAVDESEKLIQTEFDKAYIFYYLPDYIRDDPIYLNELVPKQKSADWLVVNGYDYDKKAGDKCRTHSFLFPFHNVAQKTKILSEWVDDEEYNMKWKYSLNDMLDIIDAGAKQLSADNLNIALQKKEDGDDQPLFWDTLLAVWFVLVGRHGETPADIVAIYKLAMLPALFEKIKPIFQYIGKHGADDNIDDVLNIIDQLWQKNKMYNDSKGVEMYHKMIGLMVDQATRSESSDNNADEKEEKTDHDAEKKRFEGQVKMLQFLNADQSGWLNDSGTGIKRDEIMEQLKNKYEAKLDELGCVLTDYYNNELFEDPNYDELIGEIKGPDKENLILRQDKKQILQRCKWGPFENDKINEEKYKQDLESKYGLIPVDNLSDDRIKNSFKNAYVDFVLQVGGELQDPFQKAMRALFADTKGEFCEAPIKKFERCLQKIDYDYKDERQPVGAHILDIVRCLVVYENIQDLSAAYNKLTSKYKVCRLKNNFVRNAQVFGNYRCLMVNVLFEHPSNENLKMICEVQLTVRKVYVVRLTMHKTYKLFRAILPEDDAMLF